MANKMRFFVDYINNEKSASLAADNPPLGKCREKEEGVWKYGIVSGSIGAFPAIYEIYDIPDKFNKADLVAHLLEATEIQTAGRNYQIPFKLLMRDEVAKLKYQSIKNNTERLEYLMARYKLTGLEIAEMTRRKPQTVYTWTSTERTTEIPQSALDLLRYKLKHKELILASESYRVEDKASKRPYETEGGSEIGFWELMPEEQLDLIKGEYNLHFKEVAKLVSKKERTAYKWMQPREGSVYSPIPEGEMELLLIRLGEKIVPRKKWKGQIKPI